MVAPGFHWSYPYAVSQCKGCSRPISEAGKELQEDATFCGGTSGRQRRIWKTSRTSPGLYMSALAAQNVRGGPNNAPKKKNAYVNWNQMSDRAVPGRQVTYQPRQRTRHRPGGTRPVGIGVDVKHGSYDRYLNRKKGNLLLAVKPKWPCPTAAAGDKRSRAYITTPCDCS